MAAIDFPAETIRDGDDIDNIKELIDNVFDDVIRFFSIEFSETKYEDVEQDLRTITIISNLTVRNHNYIPHQIDLMVHMLAPFRDRILDITNFDVNNIVLLPNIIDKNRDRRISESYVQRDPERLALYEEFCAYAREQGRLPAKSVWARFLKEGDNKKRIAEIRSKPLPVVTGTMFEIQPDTVLNKDFLENISCSPSSKNQFLAYRR